MAFTHGKLTKLHYNGYDLTSYFRQVSLSGAADTADCTAFGKNSRCYTPGQVDATVSADGMWDSSAGASGTVIDTALASDGNELNYWPTGDTVGEFGFGIQATETAANKTSPVDDVVAISAEWQSSVGGERCVSQRALASATASGTATVVDNTAASSAGFSGYLHVTSAAGGTVTVVLQDSADNSSYSPLTGGTFTAVSSAPSSERIAGTANPRRYTRAVWTLTGGTVSFGVSLSRQPYNYS